MPTVTITADLGRRVAPAFLAEVVNDVATISESVAAWTELEAEHQAYFSLAEQALRGADGLMDGLRADLSEARRQEVIDWTNDIQAARLWRQARVSAWNSWDAELDPRNPPGWAVGPTPQIPTLDSAPPGVIALVGRFLELQHPVPPPFIESLSYQNPVEVVVGAVAVGGTLLLTAATMIRDWPARRRIASATARDAELAVEAKAEFRRLLLSRYGSGDLVAPPAEVERLIGPAPIEAMERLAALDPAIDVDERND